MFCCYATIIANWELLSNRFFIKDLLCKNNTPVCLLKLLCHSTNEKSVYFTFTSDQSVLHVAPCCLCHYYSKLVILGQPQKVILKYYISITASAAKSQGREHQQG